MPTLELALLLKSMPRAELAAALKRTANAIFDHGGVLRKMENLGVRPTPYKISSHDASHKEAHYFVFSFDANSSTRKSLIQNYLLDVDIVRCRIFHRSNIEIKPKEINECTLHQDLLPPPYRPVVKEMIAQGQRRLKPRFKYNSGLDYYPFQR